VREVRASGAFLPWLPPSEGTRREVERWAATDLDTEVEAVARCGALVHARRVLVYRPYWLAVVVTHKGTERVLVDGQFGTIAGYPEEGEMPGLLRQTIADPLHSQEPSFRKVVLVASAAPTAGTSSGSTRGTT